MEKNKGQVLIVDDEIYIQEILKSTLEDDGFDCVIAGNAEAAEKALASQNFDIAFMDIQIPGKQEMQLLQEIKSEYPEVVVIVVADVATRAHQRPDLILKLHHVLGIRCLHRHG